MTPIEKNELLIELANCEDDDKKIQIIKDMVDPNMVLYRYRPFGYDEEKRKKEVLSLKKLTPWSSRYDKLDDQLEGINSNSGLNDLQNAQQYLNRDYNSIIELQKSLKLTSSKKDKHRLYDMFNTSKNTLRNKEFKKINQKGIEVGERVFRNKLSMVCFTENNPYDENNLWEEYTENRGFCIEYSLFDILDAGYIIAPIYYTDDRSLSKIKDTYNNEAYVYLTKTKKGKNKFTKESADWEHQNEWRIVSKNNENKVGDYLKKEIIPKKIIAMNIPNIGDIEETVNELNRTKDLKILYCLL